MKKVFAAIVALVLVFSFGKANACTNFLITKGASTDGSCMISYAADSHVLYGELYHYPATDWPAGAMLDVYDWDGGMYRGQIPQVAHTYNVVGNMNEWQLAIGETTYGGLENLENKDGIVQMKKIFRLTSPHIGGLKIPDPFFAVQISFFPGTKSAHSAGCSFVVSIWESSRTARLPSSIFTCSMFFKSFFVSSFNLGSTMFMLTIVPAGSRLIMVAA